MVSLTKYLRPNARREHVEIEMPPDIEALARRFGALGGKFTIEDLGTVGIYAIQAELDLVHVGPMDICTRLLTPEAQAGPVLSDLVRDATGYAEWYRAHGGPYCTQCGMPTEHGEPDDGVCPACVEALQPL